MKYHDFRFSAGTGHYTQIVWANTYKIGCGYTAYRKRNFVKKFIVCNYGDAGNLLGAPMYEVGRPCSKCPANICSRKNPGLCPVPGETGLPSSDPSFIEVDINNDVENIRPSTQAGAEGKRIHSGPSELGWQVWQLPHQYFKDLLMPAIPIF